MRRRRVPTAEDGLHVSFFLERLANHCGTRQAAADQLKVSVVTVSRAIRGACFAPKLLHRLRDAYGVTRLEALSHIDPRTTPMLPDRVEPWRPPLQRAIQAVQSREGDASGMPSALATALHYHAAEGRWSPAMVAIVKSGALNDLSPASPGKWTRRIDYLAARLAPVLGEAPRASRPPLVSP